MDPSIAKIQSSQRYSLCFFLFIISYPFVKFQSLLNDYVNKAKQKYSKLEELSYYKSSICYKKLQLIFYFQLLSLIQSSYS